MFKKVTTFLTKETQRLLARVPEKFLHAGFEQAMLFPQQLCMLYIGVGSRPWLDRIDHMCKPLGTKEISRFPSHGSAKDVRLRIAFSVASRVEAHIDFVSGNYARVTVRLYEQGKGQSVLAEWEVHFSPDGLCSMVQSRLHNSRIDQLADERNAAIQT